MTSFPYNFTLPAVFNEKEVAVNLPPSNTPTKMSNPLYSFKFTTESGLFQRHRPGLLCKPIYFCLDFH